MAELAVGEHVADVVVSSPRYTMPPDQILSTFPPAMAEGDFGSRLPQIALKRRTLPWERDPGGPALGAQRPAPPLARAGGASPRARAPCRPTPRRWRSASRRARSSRTRRTPTARPATS